MDDTKNDQKTCIKLWFIDAYRFLASSLDKLASFFSKDKLRILQHEFSNLSEENFNLLTKSVFMSTLTMLKSWRSCIYRFASHSIVH